MSKTVGASALAIMVVAGTAMAAGPFEPIPAAQRGIIGHGLLSADQYTLEDKGIGSFGTRATEIYNGIEFTSVYTAATAATGFGGWDDYQTSTAPGGSYGVLLPADGAHWWGITITGGMYIPSDGIAQAWFNDGSFTAYGSQPGFWMYSEGAPSIGTNSDIVGQFAPNYNMHTIVIPAPASLAMLGLGGALAVRRRR